MNDPYKTVHSFSGYCDYYPGGNIRDYGVNSFCADKTNRQIAQQEIIPGKPYHTYIFNYKTNKHTGTYAVCDMQYKQIILSDEQVIKLNIIASYLGAKENPMEAFHKIASLLSIKGKKEFLSIIDSIENEEQAEELFSGIDKYKDDEGR